MADKGWKTNPSIQEAKRVAQARGSTAVIMILVNENEGTIELATYGTTGPRCTAIGKLGDIAYSAVMEAW